MTRIPKVVVLPAAREREALKARATSKRPRRMNSNLRENVRVRARVRWGVQGISRGAGRGRGSDDDEV